MQMWAVIPKNEPSLQSVQSLALTATLHWAFNSLMIFALTFLTTNSSIRFSVRVVLATGIYLQSRTHEKCLKWGFSTSDGDMQQLMTRSCRMASVMVWCLGDKLIYCWLYTACAPWPYTPSTYKLGDKCVDSYHVRSDESKQALTHTRKYSHKHTVYSI